MKANFVSRGGACFFFRTCDMTRSLPKHLLSAMGAPVDDTVGVKSLKRCPAKLQGTHSHKQLAFVILASLLQTPKKPDQNWQAHPFWKVFLSQEACLHCSFRAGWSTSMDSKHTAQVSS